MASSVRLICAQKLIIFYTEWILSFLYINQSQLFVFFFFFFVAKTFKTLRPCIFSVTFKNQLALRCITKFVNPLYTRLLYSYLICGLMLNLVSLLRPKSFLFRVESILFFPVDIKFPGWVFCFVKLNQISIWASPQVMEN